jgi:hypothetical protein
VRRALTALVVVGLSACTSMRPATVIPVDPVDLGVPGEEDPFKQPARCTSGLTRNPNESEGPEMMPGRTCIACHIEQNTTSGEGDAPVFAFAGTVFPSGHEPDDCIASASEGAEVVVLDAKGQEFRAAVGRTGNFDADGVGLTFPITAKVVYQGRERLMKDPQDSGDCNHCHTAAGAFKAPGRVLLP